MTGTCLTCDHAALRDPVDGERDKLLRRLVKQSLINCTRTPARAGFFSLNHTCPLWSAARDDVVAKRTAWLKKTTEGPTT